MEENNKTGKSVGKRKLGFKGFIPIATRAFFLFVLVTLIVYSIVIVSTSADQVNEFSERTARINFDGKLESAESFADVHYQNLYAIADELQYAEDRTSVETAVAEYIGDPRFGDLRYYTKGAAYSAAGVLIENELSGNEMISALTESKQAGCTAVYYDRLMEVDCVAFFVPVRGSSFVDGLLSIVPTKDIIDISPILEDELAAVAVIDSAGDIYSKAQSDELYEALGNNIYTFVDKMTNDPEQVADMRNLIGRGERAADTVKLGDGTYVVCISPIEKFGDNLCLITVSPVTALAAPELVYVRHVVNICILTVITLAVGVAYAYFYSRRVTNEMYSAISTDALLGCPNLEQFKVSAAKSLANREHRYAVAVLELRQFQYLSERLSENDMTDFLKFVAKVIETFCKPRETYCYLGDGRFALFMVYESDGAVRDRMRLIETVVNKNSILGASRANKKFSIGVALTSDVRRQSVPELLAHANIAAEKARNDVKLSFAFYTEEIGTERINNERIESEMESALQSGEFRLFLQPKYNVKEDRIDSAEALVRWFDPKKGDYRFPGEFIGLFESNGFITKLDHFMYIEALKFLSNAAERGEKVVPISVNVSMVTVSTPDFLNFYIENKKKYRVADGFIMIEFTESFAMEDQHNIRMIVDTLHKNGIGASLDDFGSGYSSLGVLKNVPFDEIKFDRFFLGEGHSTKNDNTMLESLFKLAKELNIKVVQEGVETKEMFDNIVAKGCDVIQGYYYAKAISSEEFRLFISSNTSIKYKSRVK